MPSTQQEILRLSRDVESGRTIYLQLLTRQQELNISRSSAVGNVRIIDEAVTHPDPIKPRKALIIILGALFGLMLAMGTVLVRRAFKRGITLSEQLEAQGCRFWLRCHVPSGCGVKRICAEKSVLSSLETQNLGCAFPARRSPC